MILHAPSTPASPRANVNIECGGGAAFSARERHQGHPIRYSCHMAKPKPDSPVRRSARLEGRDMLMPLYHTRYTELSPQVRTQRSAPGLLVSGLCFAEEKIAGHDSTSDVSIR
jgi:hypothetical protein